MVSRTMLACAAAVLGMAGLVRGGEGPGQGAEPARLEDAPELKGLADRWRPLLEEFLVPGMAVAVVKDGKLLGIECFGVRDAARKQPVTPDTMFYIASITKTYTGLLVCMLADQGKLSLDDPVKKHLARFKLADSAATERITIRDLLTHKAGLQSGPIVWLDAYTGEITEDRYYTLLARVKPDPSVTYSNVHYTLLGRVIEAATGRPWREALEQMVFKPAGMTRTTGYASRMYGDPDHADPMEWLPGRGLGRADNVKVDATMHAAGGLGTTAADGARWLMLHLNDGRAGSSQLLSAGAAAQMRVEQAPYPKPSGSLRIMTGHGLAWATGTFMGRAYCDHGGGYEGASAYAALLPEQRSGFFILMNSGGPAKGLGDVMAIDLLNRLAGENAAPNLLDGYLKRVREGRAKAEADGIEERGGPLPAGALSGAVASYAGDFWNSEWGVIHAAAAGKALRLTMGSSVLRLKPGERDGFTIAGPFAEGAKGRFEKDAEGRIAAVVLELREFGEARFSR